MGKEGESRMHKEGIGGIWGKDKCRDKEARKVRYSRRKGFQKKRTTGEIYGKNTV